ncbi:hypothetical protein BDY24DRAFT_342056 [Mrakia frigida]|uniref:choline-phosphate cytidylyltransferase n=1 Tax=Mrakia frigida TaxID=29902 RepID=UPI003FCC1445
MVISVRSPPLPPLLKLTSLLFVVCTDSSSTSVANQPIDPIVPKSPPTPSSSSFTNLPDPIHRGTTPTPPEPSKSTTPSPPSPAALPTPVIQQLPQEDIRAFVQRAVDGVEEPGIGVRSFKVNSPPTDRPVRIYADGVYDLFHYGHALQMRQAKLCFPSVHLIIGVCSDDLCKSHKALPALTHAERCESVKHCRWVDEVAPDAPWELTQEFLDKYQVDYVAHDEEPYATKGKEDVYEFVKRQGKFLPTRRTPGISTSDLLERIVSEYRDGMFDGKFSKVSSRFPPFLSPSTPLFSLLLEPSSTPPRIFSH